MISECAEYGAIELIIEKVLKEKGISKADAEVLLRNYLSGTENTINKKFIDAWLAKYDNLQNFTPTQRKMEWQAGDKIKSLWEGVIQFRPSGIRVKTPTCFPALVAIVQIPIIGKFKRRLTVREAARLQSFPNTFIPDADDHQAYKQFGNAVNVDVIEQAARKLFEIK